MEYYLCDSNGNKVYEGQFKDGYEEGYGIAYHSNGNKAYEGDLKMINVKAMEYYIL